MLLADEKELGAAAVAELSLLSTAAELGDEAESITGEELAAAAAAAAVVVVDNAALLIAEEALVAG